MKTGKLMDEITDTPGDVGYNHRTRVMTGFRAVGNQRVVVKYGYRVHGENSNTDVKTINKNPPPGGFLFISFE
jgi:hypothetical protein